MVKKPKTINTENKTDNEEQKFKLNPINIGGIEYKSSKKELIWLLKLLLDKGEGVSIDKDTTIVSIKKIMEGPFPSEVLTTDQSKASAASYISGLIHQVIKDNVFFRKHKIIYKPIFYRNEKSFGENGSIFFFDFTDDFLEVYLEERLGIKSKNKPVLQPQRYVSGMEQIIWFLKTLIKEREKTKNFYNLLAINDYRDICVRPFIRAIDSNDYVCQIIDLTRTMIEDIDFYRQHRMENYNPRVKSDIPPNGVVFMDFTYDLLTSYLKDRLNVKNISENEGALIEKIEILKDNSNRKAIVLYINGNYDIPIVFNRGKTSNLLYDLARDGEVPYDRSSFDYMNSNIAHPFYSKYGFAVSKILKQEKNFIQPNIPITLKHQKSITQTKNKISK